MAIPEQLQPLKEGKPSFGICKTLEQIGGSEALYRHIHRQGPKIGIETVVDLGDRIFGPEDYRRLWVGYCLRWLEENDEAAIKHRAQDGRAAAREPTAELAWSDIGPGRRRVKRAPLEGGS